MASDIKYPKWLPRALRPAPPFLRRARAFTARTLGGRLPEARRLAGWLHPDQSDALCYLAHSCPPGAIVEIGSFRGKSTVYLAKGMKPDNDLTAIDPHVLTRPGSRADRARADDEGEDAGATSWDDFNRTLREWDIAGKTAVVRDYSYNARRGWTRPISFLWIDGDHRYAAVRRDIEDWVDLVASGGFLAFHDTYPRDSGDGSVRRAIMDTDVLGRRGFATVIELRNAWYMKRTG